MRGFPVEFAALGFLVAKPSHGYALRSRIAEGLGPLWQIASSQLYQVLHRLEERGLVRSSSESSATGPSRAVHQVTAAGERAFWKWAQVPVASMRDVRVEFAAKLYFLRKLNPVAVGVLVDRQLAVLEELKARVASSTRKGSDDSGLNLAWHELQTTTIDNFAKWLKDHRKKLSADKENTT